MLTKISNYGIGVGAVYLLNINQTNWILYYNYIYYFYYAILSINNSNIHT